MDDVAPWVRFHSAHTTRSVYSAWEHSFLPTTPASPLPSSTLPRVIDPRVNLPLDITLETIFSVLLLCVGVVMSTRELQPIQWNAWAGRLERSKDARRYEGVGQGGGNPYARLEERTGFLDIREEQEGFCGVGERWGTECEVVGK